MRAIILSLLICTGVMAGSESYTVKTIPNGNKKTAYRKLRASVYVGSIKKSKPAKYTAIFCRKDPKWVKWSKTEKTITVTKAATYTILETSYVKGSPYGVVFLKNGKVVKVKGSSSNYSKLSKLIEKCSSLQSTLDKLKPAK